MVENLACSRYKPAFLRDSCFLEFQRRSLPGNLIPALLDNVLPVLTSLRRVDIDSVTLSGEDAGAIFGRLKASRISELRVSVHFTNDVMNALIY